MAHLRNTSVKTLFGFLSTAAIVGYLIIDASEQPGSYEVRQGQRVLYQMMGEETLRQAGFYQAYPQGRPSDFVAFVGSAKGQALWPETESTFQEANRQVPRAEPGRVLLPDGLRLTAHQVDPNAQKQIVYIPHDDTGQMELRAHEAPDAKPVFVYEWDFPTDAGRVPLR